MSVDKRKLSIDEWCAAGEISKEITFKLAELKKLTQGSVDGNLTKILSSLAMDNFGDIKEELQSEMFRQYPQLDVDSGTSVFYGEPVSRVIQMQNKQPQPVKMKRGLSGKLRPAAN